MRLIIQFSLLVILLSCSQANADSTNRIDHSNIKSIFNKPLNLVFIWTTWCGVSKSILKETYTSLQRDSNRYNIILICGNDDPIGVDNYFKSIDIQLKKYIIDKSSNHFPFLDRSNIKEFIFHEFKNNNTKLNGNFGVPISLLLDS